MSKSPSRGLTRRGLFRGIGTAGTAAALASCKAQPETEAPDQPQAAPSVEGAFGLEPAPLRFTLDGEVVETQAEARTTLLELLRLDLDATGPKLVCDRGACGACMVLVDGVARNSCMLLAHDVEGAEVTTVAGLSERGEGAELGALQAAFVEHDALQCGFCTSGMLISATALLRARKDGPAIEAADVREAIAGNLCRCGTYPHVVAAVLSVARGETVTTVPTQIIAVGETGKTSKSSGKAS
ncbi:(2Fe-2S)-binding protein [Pseudenhygromyxa sp. WMMC2535]|uniref:(2Fe-2S)-binding protein n=1 Tax=Pseudenhygromyxa sp. WMMC2535 TaxID=2712867 RepID=UPI001555D260|nr:(2Fe-2S)-binding protein [Pseudenhygromyxa sp. WMMC2535]NVB38987.1 (2Fe-2S)-binding protein [Pseudenhygromyxa sp. WMMC2535]